LAEAYPFLGVQQFVHFKSHGTINAPAAPAMPRGSTEVWSRRRIRTAAQ